jgi:hypothetical protein
MQPWLPVVISSLGPLVALIVGFVGADRFLRGQLGAKRRQAPLEIGDGTEIGPISRGRGITQ